MHRLLRKASREVAESIATQIEAAMKRANSESSDLEERYTIAKAALKGIQSRVNSVLSMLDSKISVSQYRARMRNVRKAQAARRGKKGETP